MGITQQMAQEVVGARFQDIPAQAVQRVKEAILDDVGIAFLGYAKAGKTLVDYAKDVGGGRRESTIIGDGARVACFAAAGANAQMAYDTDFEETGPGHHALSAYAQTAIAVGERTGSSGQDVITAVAIAYEMGGRFQNALLPPEVVGGTQGKRHIPMAVAMAAGKLLGLDARQMNHALGVAWYFAPQPSEFLWRNRWWKRFGNFHVGNCQLGIQAALLAHKGFEGPMDVIEKEVFYNVDRLGSSPGAYYHPLHKLHLKPWLASRECHPGIQATLEIMRAERLRPEDIQAITFRGLELYMDFPFNNPDPKEYWDVIYSVQWAVALSVLGYEPGYAWLTEERLNDPVCRALARKVVLAAEPAASEEYAQGLTKLGDYPNEVEVSANGRTYRKRKTGHETLGSPAVPMSREQLARKFTAQAAPIIGAAQGQQLLEALHHLDEQQDIRNVTRLFKPPARRKGA